MWECLTITVCCFFIVRYVGKGSMNVEKLFNKVGWYGEKLIIDDWIDTAMTMLEGKYEGPQYIGRMERDMVDMQVLKEDLLDCCVEDANKFGNTLKETMKNVKAGETGIITLAHMGEISRQMGSTTKCNAHPK